MKSGQSTGTQPTHEMLTPEHWSMSPTEEDDVCYTDLQPVIDMTSLITSSTDPCLALYPDEGYCVEYTICTEETPSDFQADCAVYNLPDSPQSLSEEECTILSPDLLQTHLYEDSQVYDDEDDDASVMLDLMDLSFLDEPDMNSEEQGYGRLSFTDSLDTCPTVVVGAARTCCSQFHHRYYPITPSPSPPSTSPSPSCPSPSSSPSSSSSSFCSPSTGTPTVPPSPPTPTPTNHSSSSSSSFSSSSSTTFTFHYVDQPPTTITTIVGAPSPTSNDDDDDDDDDDQSLLRSRVPTAASIRSALAKRVRGGRKGQQQRQQQQQQQQLWQQLRQTEERETSGSENKSPAAASSMDFDTFDNSDHESDDFKPYCGSRRGAKKNLLWKFLLWTLDNHSDVLSWTDVHRGVFKFVDTGRASTLWGQRKKKQGMTFEKLSRGIRHYYKLGLMERLPHTRLMYKFNWDKVPKKYRKA